jgi:hypothetical protein
MTSKIKTSRTVIITEDNLDEIFDKVEQGRKDEIEFDGPTITIEETSPTPTLDNVLENQFGFITDADLDGLISEGFRNLPVVIRCHEKRVPSTVGKIRAWILDGTRLDEVMDRCFLTLRDVYTNPELVAQFEIRKPNK